MERRAFVAILLSILVVLGWNYLFPKPDPVVDPDAAAVQAAAGELPAEDPSALDDRPSSDPDAPAAAVSDATAAASERTLRIQTDLVDVTFTNRGARATSWRLKDYMNRSGEPLELLPSYADGGESGLLGIALETERMTRRLQDALFESETDEGADGPIARFRWSDGQSLEVEREFRFDRDTYSIDVVQRVVDRGVEADSGVVIGPGFGAQEKSSGRSRFYSQSSGGLWATASDIKHKKTSKLDDQKALTGPLQWVGLEDQYFAALAVPGGQITQADWSVAERTPMEVDSDEAGDAIEEPQVVVRVPADDAIQVYVGPKKVEDLRAAGNGLERSVKFYGWIAPLARLIYTGLLWLQANVVSNWGLAIILATFMLRTALFPLNQFAMTRMKKSQIEMQGIQPKLKAVQKKYAKRKDAESRAAMQRETMELYRQEGINPAGPALGCLPMLLQMPILIAFYNMLTVAIELRGAPFALWIQDLSIPDPTYITPLLMGATMFVQQRMSMTKAKDPQQRQQQQILMVMPLVFTIICVGAPSGLVLYWFFNNLLGMGQQWLVNKQFARVNDSGTGKGKDNARKDKSVTKSPRTRNA